MVGPNLPRNKLIRQDRFDVDPERCVFEIKKEKFKVENISRFGVALRTNIKFDNFHLYYEGVLLYDQTEVVEIRVRLVRVEELGENDYRVGFEVVGEPINIERYMAISDAHKVVKKHIDESGEQLRIPMKFKNIVYQTTDWLNGLRGHLEELNKIYELPSRFEIEDCESAVSQVITGFLNKSFPPVFKALAATLKDADNDTKKAALEYFRSHIKSLIYPWVPDHSYHSQSNVFSIVDNHHLKMTYHPHRLFSICLHNYFIAEPYKAARDKRVGYLVNLLQNIYVKSKAGRLKILSLGCDSTEEIIHLLDNYKELHDGCFELYITDNEEEKLKSLQYRMAQLNLVHNTNFSFTYVHLPVEKILRDGIDSDDFSIIYSLDTFEYLHDNEAHALGERLVAALETDGKLLVGSYSVSTPSQITMSVVLDWDLLYRTTDDLKRIFGQLGRRTRLLKPKDSVNLFIETIK